MTQTNWWKHSVVYQIYPRSFKDSNGDGIGDLKGIIEKLDYLKELGIDVIWLCPVYRSPMEDNGYDIADYQDIDPLFGSLDTMDELIKEAKKRGIRIIMDLVVNHTSSEHPWFKESRKSKDNPYRNFYIWRDEPNDLRSTFGGPAWTFDEQTGQYYFHNFAKGQPDLNWENPKVRQEVYKMINWWLDRGIAGFRMDVIDLIGKDIDNKILSNGPTLHQYLQEMHRESFGNYDTLTVGETWGATPEIAELYSDPDRKELSMIFQFEHMTIDWGEYGKWTPIPLDFVRLKQILNKWQHLEKGWIALFWNNHDLPRIVSRFGNDEEYRVESAKMLAMVLHFMKGTPYIFQGEEIGMTNVKFPTIDDYKDVEIHGFYKDYVLEQKIMTHDEFMEGVYYSGRDNARTPMQWDDSENAGFTTGTPWIKINPNFQSINVKAALEDQNSIFFTYKKLIELRKNSPYADTIKFGEFELLLEDDEQIFSYIRSDEQNRLLLVANFTKEIVDVTIDEAIVDVIMSNYDNPPTDLTNIKLRPYEAIVYEIK